MHVLERARVLTAGISAVRGFKHSNTHTKKLKSFKVKCIAKEKGIVHARVHHANSILRRRLFNHRNNTGISLPAVIQLASNMVRVLENENHVNLLIEVNIHAAGY